jgi:hypothetical protein
MKEKRSSTSRWKEIFFGLWGHPVTGIVGPFSVVVTEDRV